MPSIKARIEALAALLQGGGNNIRDVPYESLDPISRGVMDLVRELDALDSPEKKAAYCAENGLAVNQLEEFIRSVTVDY